MISRLVEARADKRSDRTQHENGAFGHQIVVKADAQMKLPDNVSDTDAATLGVSVVTVVRKTDSLTLLAR